MKITIELNTMDEKPDKSGEYMLIYLTAGNKQWTHTNVYYSKKWDAWNVEDDYEQKDVLDLQIKASANDLFYWVDNQ